MSSLLHSEESFGIVVHGGAGVMSGLSEERQQQIHKKIQETVSEAYEILEQGGSSFDAVELAVSMLEDSPLFNAGRGSVYNSDEVQEMDSEIANLQNSPTGTLRVSAPAAFGRRYLVPLVFEFRKDFPDLSIDLSFNKSIPSLSALSSFISIIARSGIFLFISNTA